MSDMYEARVLERESSSVLVEVRQSHPDYGVIPYSSYFGLQLLLDVAYRLEIDRWLATGPLGEQIPRETFEAMADRKTGVELAPIYVTGVEVVHARRVPFDADRVVAELAQRLRDRGVEEGGDDWDEAFEVAWQTWWNEEPPVAALRIGVTDPKWIQHLSPGQKFEGAGWCLQGPYVEQEVG